MKARDRSVTFYASEANLIALRDLPDGKNKTDIINEALDRHFGNIDKLEKLELRVSAIEETLKSNERVHQKLAKLRSQALKFRNFRRDKK